MNASIEFAVNKHNPNGEFYLIFIKDPNVRFYGQEMPSLQRFRRYGNLPDNNVAANKIINQLGRHLLNMEVKHPKIKNLNKLTYHQIEKTANALYIDLFCELSTIEQGRLTNVDKNSLNTSINHIFDRYIVSFAKIPVAKSLMAILQQKKANLLQQLEKLTIDNYEIRNFYQFTLNDFRDIQQQISFMQRPFLGVAETANSSLTEAYNDAFYELEAHKFGSVAPTELQVWKNLDEGLLSTEEMPNVRKDYALKTFCIDESGDYKPGDYDTHRTKIKNENLQEKKEQLEKSKNQEVQEIRYGNIENIEQFYQTISQDLPPKVRHLREDPLVYFEESDFFSAIGAASLSVGKYFERELGAKHPLVCLGFFLTASITFTAAGLGSVGVAPALMQKVVLGVSKMLSANGHIIAPEKIAHVINQISEEWLHLCHTDGKMFQTLVMNGMGLPKLTFLAADSLFFNGLEEKDSISVLAEKFIPENLTGETRSEAIQQTTENLIKAAFVLGIAVGAGLGSEQLITHKGILGAVGSLLNKIADVPSAVFIDLANASTTAQRIQAVVALLLTVKTAGLLVGKVALLFMNMAEPSGASVEELKAFNDQKDAVHMMEILLLLKSSEPDKYNTLIEQKKIPNKTVIDNFKKACDNYPDIKEKFAKQSDFLTDFGIQSKESFFKFIFRVLGGIFGFILSPLAIFPTVVTSFSPEREKEFSSLSKDEGFLGALVFVYKFISDKFLAPVVGSIYLAAWLLSLPSNLFFNGATKAVRDTKGFSDGLKLLIGLARLGIFLWTPIKMLMMGIYELVKRSLMFVVNFIAKLCLVVNAIFQGDFSAAFAGIKSAFGELAGIVAFVVDQFVGFVVGFIDLGKTLVNIFIFTINLIPDTLRGLRHWIDGYDIVSAFKKSFNEPLLPSIDTQGFGAARRAYLDDYSVFSKTKDWSADNEIELTKAAGGEAIQDWRLWALGAIHGGFSWLEDNVFAKIATFIRSYGLRNMEETAQDIDYNRLGHAKPLGGSTDVIQGVVGQGPASDDKPDDPQMPPAQYRLFPTNTDADNENGNDNGLKRK